MKRIVVLLLFTLAPGVAYALEVREVRWGFDGKVPPGRFAPLSVLLANQSENAYEGMLTLHRTDNFGARRGARLVRPCFVSPYSSRWVQFYPYVNSEDEKWILSWGRGAKQAIAVPRTKLGAPALVFLTDPDDPFAGRVGLKTFPENLFPTSVTATDGLYSVALDHAPGWEAPRREAFMDWVRRGGIVHILHGGNGEYPEFPVAQPLLKKPLRGLSALNSPLEVARGKKPLLKECQWHRVGAGLVVRHPVTRHKFSVRVLKGRAAAFSKVATPPRSGFLKSGYATAPQLKEGEYYGINKLEDSFFKVLDGMARPEHNWTLIYLLVVAYLVAVGPVNYFFGRKRKNYWHTILFFAVCVTCFGGVLTFVGSRGYGGGGGLVHTLSYARPVGEGIYDVSQWTSVFVTRGRYYRLAHPSTHNLYSTCQDYEKVEGDILNGKDGMLRVDIPMYSSRTLHHRGKMKGHNIKLEVVAWEGEETLKRLSLSTGPEFPEDVLEMQALHGGRFYRLRKKGNLIEVVKGAPCRPISEFLPRRKLSDLEYHRWVYMGFAPEPELAKKIFTFEKMVRLLVARSIGGTESFLHYVELPPPPDERVQVFIYARSPRTFHLSEATFGKETGYVLYHIDVVRP